MRSVLISIQPKWCELIANGSKTIEVRKTKPKLDTPFKVYIYCTKPFYRKGDGYFQGKYCGKVIGEFVCDEIECFTTDYRANKEQTERISKLSCVSWLGMAEYEINSHCLYGWHISNLVIYDKPRELSEFVVEGDCLNGDCKKCKWFDSGNDYNVEADCLLPYDFHFKKAVKPLFRPPQSWCYVESLGDTQ